MLVVLDLCLPYLHLGPKCLILLGPKCPRCAETLPCKIFRTFRPQLWGRNVSYFCRIARVLGPKCPDTVAALPCKSSSVHIYDIVIQVDSKVMQKHLFTVNICGDVLGRMAVSVYKYCTIAAYVPNLLSARMHASSPARRLSMDASVACCFNPVSS